MNYNNEICQGCGRKLQEGDDIVTCPECGTPQHRECWLKEHRCVNEHLHADGFEWKPRHSEEKKPPQPEEKIVCPFCGSENPKGAKGCSVCSQPFEIMGRSVLPPQEEKKPDGYAYKPPFKIDYEEPESDEPEFFELSGITNDGEVKFTFEPQREPEVLGEKISDFGAYVRAGTKSYYKKFKKHENGRKLTFNFAALIFGPLWFFFRKLYKAGIVFLALSLCVTMAFYAPISEVSDKYYAFAEELNEISRLGEEATDEQVSEIIEKAYNFMEENMGIFIKYAAATVSVNIAAALAADSLYKKKFIHDMNDAREEAQGNEEKRKYLILRKGGITLFAPAAAYAATQLLISFLTKEFF